MPTERSARYWQQAKKVETLVLLLTAPFLLFPERSIFLTTGSLILLGLLWLAPLVFIREALLPPTPYNVALLLFCFSLCAAILVSADPLLTLPKATGIILGLATWRYLVIAIQRQSDVARALTAYVLVGLGFVLVGLLNANWLLKATAQVPFLGEALRQPFAALPFLTQSAGIHPNQLAGTITLILPLLVTLWAGAPFERYERPGLLRGLVAAGVLLCLVVLLLTQSRSAWAAVLGSMLLLLILGSLLMSPSAQRRRLRLATAVALTLAFIALLAIGPGRLMQLWLDPPQETAVGSLTSLNFRQILWPWALQALADFPFTGVGLGTFRQVALDLYPVPISSGADFAHAHNVFLQVALDLGLPGLIAYGALIVISIAIGWQVGRDNPTLRAAAVGLLACLFAFHIFGIVDTLALGSKSAVLLWAVFGLLAGMIRLR